MTISIVADAYLYPLVSTIEVVLQSSHESWAAAKWQVANRAAATKSRRAENIVAWIG